MSDIIQRLTTLRSSNSGTVGTAAVQVSGGPSSNYPLTAVSATFYPSHHRMLLRIGNTSAGIIYVGSTSAITAGNGGGWFKQIGPGQFIELACSGAVPVWLIGSAAGLTFTLEELS